MAGKYRALLIGNSTYPADEHNLQTLKGPVKDIAALNRALIDRDAGLFDDADVTLLPETSSTRALRTLSKFFGSAERDDVLLMYFSGHGKLDQSGRLHLCMQDSETTDLLSTAVSSTRINEFADASRARNVVIVLDCCHAGAFRGSDFGTAVAGPGRYVLTSCRGTQLANDATIDNGTSYFTQHLVEGLLGAAADRDHDGYVDFSDIYTYVDRQLREEGKQIPQRRVAGDGDLPLARRSGSTGALEARQPSAPTRAPQPPPPAPPRADGVRARRSRRITIALVAAGALIVTAATLTAVLLSDHRPNGNARPDTAPTIAAGGYTAKAPWRLKIADHANFSNDPGCTVAVVKPGSGSGSLRIDGVYDTRIVQIHATGPLQFKVNHEGCDLAKIPGSGAQNCPTPSSQPKATPTLFPFTSA